jgi:hypothetical protein
MTELLLSAAKRLGVPTEVTAGPGSGSSFSIWARWPRHPYEIAQDVLNEIIRIELEATVTPVGGTPLWRARHGEWTHIGRFEDAVAHLASHVALDSLPGTSPSPRPHGAARTPAGLLGSQPR